MQDHIDGVVESDDSIHLCGRPDDVENCDSLLSSLEGAAVYDLSGNGIIVIITVN